MGNPKQTVTVDCPVCRSGNGFDLGDAGEPFTCGDCGFTLANAGAGLDSGRCIICGNDRFYFESPFSMTFLGRTTRCYVCDARYDGVHLSQADANYSDETAIAIATSTAATNLKARVEHWH